MIILRLKLLIILAVPFFLSSCIFDSTCWSTGSSIFTGSTREQYAQKVSLGVSAKNSKWIRSSVQVHTGDVIKMSAQGLITLVPGFGIRDGIDPQAAESCNQVTAGVDGNSSGDGAVVDDSSSGHKRQSDDNDEKSAEYQANKALCSSPDAIYKNSGKGEKIILIPNQSPTNDTNKCKMSDADGGWVTLKNPTDCSNYRPLRGQTIVISMDDAQPVSIDNLPSMGADANAWTWPGWAYEHRSCVGWADWGFVCWKHEWDPYISGPYQDGSNPTIGKYICLPNTAANNPSSIVSKCAGGGSVTPGGGSVTPGGNVSLPGACMDGSNWDDDTNINTCGFSNSCWNVKGRNLFATIGQDAINNDGQPDLYNDTPKNGVIYSKLLDKDYNAQDTIKLKIKDPNSNLALGDELKTANEQIASTNSVVSKLLDKILDLSSKISTDMTMQQALIKKKADEAVAKARQDKCITDDPKNKPSTNCVLPVQGWVKENDPDWKSDQNQIDEYNKKIDKLTDSINHSTGAYAKFMQSQKDLFLARLQIFIDDQKNIETLHDTMQLSGSIAPLWDRHSDSQWLEYQKDIDSLESQINDNNVQLTYNNKTLDCLSGFIASYGKTTNSTSTAIGGYNVYVKARPLQLKNGTNLQISFSYDDPNTISTSPNVVASPTTGNDDSSIPEELRGIIDSANASANSQNISFDSNGNASEVTVQSNGYIWLRILDDKDGIYENNAGNYNVSISPRVSLTHVGIFSGLLEKLFCFISTKVQVVVNAMFGYMTCSEVVCTSDQGQLISIKPSESGSSSFACADYDNSPSCKKSLGLDIKPTIIKDLGTTKQACGNFSCKQIKKIGSNCKSDLFQIIRSALILYITIYAIMFTLGMVQVNQYDLVIRVVKIAMILYMFRPDGFVFFTQTVFPLFLNGAFWLMSAASGNSDTLNPFGFLDDIMGIFTNYITWMKLIALLFASILGWAVFLLVLYGTFVMLYNILEGISKMAIALVAVGFLLGMAPIFIPFILFSVTRELFDTWVRTLIKYTLEPVILIVGMIVLCGILQGFLNQLYHFNVCSKCAFPLMLGFPGLGWSAGTLFCFPFLLPFGFDATASAFIAISALLTFESLPMLIGFILVVKILEKFIGTSSTLSRQLMQGASERNAISAPKSGSGEGDKGQSYNMFKKAIGMDKNSKDRRAMQSMARKELIKDFKDKDTEKKAKEEEAKKARAEQVKEEQEARKKKQKEEEDNKQQQEDDVKKAQAKRREELAAQSASSGGSLGDDEAGVRGSGGAGPDLGAGLGGPDVGAGLGGPDVGAGGRGSGGGVLGDAAEDQGAGLGADVQGDASAAGQGAAASGQGAGLGADVQGDASAAGQGAAASGQGAGLGADLQGDASAAGQGAAASGQGASGHAAAGDKPGSGTASEAAAAAQGAAEESPFSPTTRRTQEQERRNPGDGGAHADDHPDQPGSDGAVPKKGNPLGPASQE